MRIIGLLIIGIIIPIISFGITEYKPEDQLFIWAASGLNLRESPNFKSQILTNIPFGQAIICKGRKSGYEYLTNSKTISDNIELRTGESIKIEFSGTWVKIKFDKYEGFVFDCYLSRFNPLLKDGDSMSLFDYFKKSADSLIYLERKDSTLEYGRNKIIFSNGIFMTENYASGGFWSQINLPDFSKEEAFLLLRYLDNHSLTEIIQEEDGTIFIGDNMGGFTIEHFKNMVMISGEWSC